MAKDKSPVAYLDNNATTSLSNDVSGVVLDMVLHDIYGNPSSMHDYGTRVKSLMDASRYSVAKSLGCGFEEVIFTSGGTESNNMAIRGVCNPFSSGGIVISAAEHSSVFNTAEAVVGDENVRLIPLLPDGNLDLNWVDELVTEDTALVSVMLANNETGVIFPVREIVEIAHKKGVLVHCDAVQAYGKIPVDVKDLGVDMLSISGHKVHALPGIGALYVRRGVLLHPSITAGSQEHGLRGGTENYIGIASLGTAANEIQNRKDPFDPGLRDAFEHGITKRVPNIVINGVESPRVPNTSNVTFIGIHSSSMVAALGELGVIASSGSACSSGSIKPSRTLKAMGCSDEDALSAVRFSFSTMSTMVDAAQAIEACARCATSLRQGSMW